MAFVVLNTRYMNYFRNRTDRELNNWYEDSLYLIYSQAINLRF